MKDERFIKISDINNQTINMVKDSFNMIELPYPKLQGIIKGIYKGDLILLESRPSMGTSTFCVNLAVALAKQKYKIAYFSLDRTSKDITLRIETCLNNFTADTENKDDLEIYISKYRRKYDYDILTEMQEMTNKFKIDLFILDYVQLLTPIGDALSNSDQDIRNYIQSFKHAIRQLNTSLLVVSKLTNGVENDQLVPLG